MAIDTFELIINSLTKFDDKVNDFYDDLIKQKYIEEKDKKKLKLIFDHIPEIIVKYRLFQRKTITEGFGLPKLVSCSSSAAIKPIYKNSFKYGIDDIHSYKPEPIGYCVVAQIKLKKNDSEETFSFQLNRDIFNRFITDLLALQSEMEQLNKMKDLLKESEK